MSHANPEAMRSEAAALRSEADSLISLSRQIQARVDGMVFEGPAATRFREALAGEGRKVDLAAVELGDLADYVVRAAVRVEAELEEERRREAARGGDDGAEGFS
jgi:uncharacterized protein YukE